MCTTRNTALSLYLFITWQKSGCLASSQEKYLSGGASQHTCAVRDIVTEMDYREGYKYMYTQEGSRRKDGVETEWECKYVKSEGPLSAFNSQRTYALYSPASTLKTCGRLFI